MDFLALFPRALIALFRPLKALSAAAVLTLCAHTAAEVRKVSVKKLIFTLKIWGNTFFFAKFVPVLL